MKKIIGLLAAATLMNSASAAIISYDFTATVHFVTETDTAKNYLTTSVTSSSLAGLPIALDQVIHGHFSIDTGTLINPASQSAVASQDGYQMYAGSFGQNNFSAAFVGGPAIESSAGASNTLQVVNSMSGKGGADTLSAGTYVYSAQSLQTASIFLDDFSGKAFNQDGVPSTLTLADFGYASFHYSYGSYTPGSKILSVDARIDSLTPMAAVPEPASYAMLAGGLLLLAWRRKTHLQSN